MEGVASCNLGVELKFETPYVKFIFNGCRTNYNVGILLSIIQKLR